MHLVHLENLFSVVGWSSLAYIELIKGKGGATPAGERGANFVDAVDPPGLRDLPNFFLKLCQFK